MTNHDKNVRILDAAFHEAALMDADEGRSTPELGRDVDAIMTFAQLRVAQMRRIEMRRLIDEPALAAMAARPSILAMTRDAMLTRLAALRAARPSAVFAHRDFAAMTDEDLRTTLEDAESIAGRRD